MLQEVSKQIKLLSKRWEKSWGILSSPMLHDILKVVNILAVH